MPIDPSIYGLQQTPRFNTPFEMLGQMQQLQQQRQIIDSNAALEQERRQKIAAQQKSIEGDQLMGQLIKQNSTVDPATGMIETNHQAVLNGLMVAGHPAKGEAYMGFADTMQKQLNDILKTKLEMHAKVFGLQRGLSDQIMNAAPDKRPEMYATRRVALGMVNPDILQQLPEQYPGDEKVKEWHDLGMTQEEALQNRLQAAKAAADESKAGLDASEAKAKDVKAKQDALILAGMSPTGLTAEQQQQNKDKQTELGQGAQRVDLEAQRVKIERDKATAAAAKGKPLSAMEADKISDIDKGISAIRDLRESIATGSTGAGAAFEAKYVPSFLGDVMPSVAAAKATQADIVRAQQVVGRIIHGGVMRQNDAAAASKYMPQIGDSQSIIKSKLDAAEKLAQQTRADHLGNLGKAGYDVSNFAAADTGAAPSASAPSLAPGKVSRVMQDGVAYDVVTDPQGKVIRATPVR